MIATDSIRMKSLIMDSFLNGSVWLGVVTSWQSEMDYWIKIMAGASAIILSWVTIFLKLKNYKNGNGEGK